ncbi:MAG: GNAT family N-acetyltransferase [Deltaproteobacteria bacterium]|nr:GNAT family N-acetyltransferase [Deltaproteobacteria bacterium]
MKMRPVRIRFYDPKDAIFLSTVFFDAVRKEGLRDYSQAQVEAWAPAKPDPASVEARARDGRLTLVAVNEVDEPIAYGDLEANGHIDHLFCRPEHIGTGVASTLYNRLEQEACERGITRLFVEASEAARKLFLRKGFVEIKRRDFILRGVPSHNYAMEKLLSASGQPVSTTRKSI